MHLPVHASRLNQMEIHFSIPQRKAITYADFPDLDTLTARIMTIQEYYNTRRDLNDFLHRRGAHEQTCAT